MKSPLLMILTAAVFLVASSAYSTESLRHVRIDNPHAEELALDLQEQGFDVLEGSVASGSLEIIASVDELKDLTAAGFTPELLAVGRPYADIQAERQVELDAPTGYPDLAEIMDQMSTTAASFPEICLMVDLTETYGTPTTIEGRHLYALKISDNVLLDEDEPAFLMVSNHHAREIVTPVLALYAIDMLVMNYGSDPAITAAVNANEIWIAPVWNPDGYSFVFSTDNMWRKNRRVFPAGIGVDQNRNYLQGWHGDCSGSDDPSSNTYKGPGPESEAETKTMVAWSRDRQFAKVLDYHSAGREVLHGYECQDHPFDDYLLNQAYALSTAAGYGGDHRPPTAEGEHYQWQLAQMGALAFLMETYVSFQPVYASALAEAALVWPGTLWFLQEPIPLEGYITSGYSGEPLEADIIFPFEDFNYFESIPSNARTGRYHAFAPDGWYNIEVNADGYEYQITDSVFINEADPAHLDVAMVSLLSGVGPGPNQGDGLTVKANSSTGRLHYELANPSQVNIEIYDLRGALMNSLVQQYQAAGQYDVQWGWKSDQGQDMPSGMYFFRISAGDAVRSGKVVLVK